LILSNYNGGQGYGWMLDSNLLSWVPPNEGKKFMVVNSVAMSVSINWRSILTKLTGYGECRWKPYGTRAFYRSSFQQSSTSYCCIPRHLPPSGKSAIKVIFNDKTVLDHLIHGLGKFGRWKDFKKAESRTWIQLKSGSYKVSLKVKNADGSNDKTVSKYIIVKINKYLV